MSGKAKPVPLTRRTRTPRNLPEEILVPIPINRRVNIQQPIQQRKSALVLDLDETLINTVEGDARDYRSALKISTLKGRIYSFYLGKDFYWGVTRPTLEVFLKEAYLTFDIVGVWSAGTYDYVHKVVDLIFPCDMKPYFVLTRDDCLVIDPGTIYEDYYKPLDVLYQRYPEINPYSTIILDDKKLVAQYNPHNHIEIPRYIVEPRFPQRYDDALVKLIKTFRDMRSTINTPLSLISIPDIFAPNENA